MADPFTVDILHLVGRYAQMANETLNDETGVASLEDASASRLATLQQKTIRGEDFLKEYPIKPGLLNTQFVQLTLAIPRYPKLTKILEHDFTYILQFCVV